MANFCVPSFSFPPHPPWITLSTASCTHRVIFSELPDDDWSRWTVRALTARSVVRHEERERDDSSPLLAPEYSYAISLDFCSDPIPQATWDFQIIPLQVALILELLLDLLNNIWVPSISNSGPVQTPGWARNGSNPSTIIFLSKYGAELLMKEKRKIIASKGEF